MLSEDINIKLGEYDYDFNTKDKIIVVKEKSENNNTIINEKNYSDKIIKNDEEKEDNIENDAILVEEECPVKKYRMKNLDGNVINLPENYSADGEDGFKFINLIKESNENYELIVVYNNYIFKVFYLNIFL